MKCKQCGTEIQNGGAFCPNCGGEIQKPHGFRNFALVLSGVVLVAAGAFFVLNPSMGKEANMVYYVKNKTLYGRDLNSLNNKNAEPSVITEDFTKKKGLDRLYEDSYYSGDIGIFGMGQVGPYQQGLVYPDSLEGSEYWDINYTLRYQKDGNSSPVKIASNVVQTYDLGPNSIVYQKENASLYLYKDGKNKKLGSDVLSVYMSEDKSKAYWVRYNLDNYDYSSDGFQNDIYYMNFMEDEKPEMMAENVDLVHISEDLSSVVMLDDKNQIVVIENNGEPKVVLSGVDKVLKSDEKGSRFYYLKNTKSFSAMDFVIDDREEIAGTTETETMEAVELETGEAANAETASAENVETETEYAEEGETETSIFDLENYGNESDVEMLLKDLEYETDIYTESELYYFENGTETLVDPKYNGDISFTPGPKGDAPMFFVYYNRPEITQKKWKLSELSSANDIEYYFTYEYDGTYQNLFLMKGEKISLEGSILSMKQNKAENKYYLIQSGEVPENIYGDYGSYYDGNWWGNLISISYAADSFGEKEEVDTSVAELFQVFNGKMIYGKHSNVDDAVTHLYDLYVEEEMIASDVFGESIMRTGEESNLYFLENGDADSGLGDLVVWDGKETRAIASDIFAYDVQNEGDILLMTDYDLEDFSGQLSHYDGKDISVIDEEVSAFINRGDGASSQAPRFYY